MQCGAVWDAFEAYLCGGSDLDSNVALLLLGSACSSDSLSLLDR